MASILFSQPAEIKTWIMAIPVSCFGGSNGAIDLSVKGGTTLYVISWSNGANTQDIGMLSAGSYTVTVTDANSCSITTTNSVQQPLNANFVFIGPGTYFNAAVNRQGRCIPPMNSPGTVIIVNIGQTLNINFALMADIINNGTLTGALNLSGNLVNNGVLRPGN